MRYSTVKYHIKKSAMFNGKCDTGNKYHMIYFFQTEASY